MGKIRVYELARELNIESKVLIKTLKSIGVIVASHQSTLSDTDVDRVKKALASKASSSSSSSTSTTKAESTVKVIRRRVVRQDSSSDSSSVTVTRTVAKPVKEVDSSKKESVQPAPVVEASLDSSKEKPVEPVQPSEQQTSATTVEDQKTSQKEPTKLGLAGRIKSFFSKDKKSDVDKKEVSTEGETVSTTTVETEASSVSADQSEKVVEAATESSKQEPEVKKPKKEKVRIGATIVRKATPEEVAASKNNEYSRSFKPRKEDTKGTHFVGIGTQQQMQSQYQESSTRWKKNSKDRKKNGNADENEDYIKKPSMVKSSKKDVFNARTILSQLDDDFDSDSDSDSIMDDPAVSRLVYTPTAASKKKILKRRTDLKKTNITVSKAQYRIVKMGENILVSDLARELKIKATEIIKKLMSQGIMVSINESIDFDTASIIASEYNYEVQSYLQTEEDVLKPLYPQNPVYVERPPIVTVMGHVDHGKTSILDAIRSTNIASKEAGGITQHIGAYFVEYNGKRISFIDTPGHEAFSSMRARGANVTDIVVLVVAADDGVMPQTIEAISHAREAGVPIIVAINKIDKDHTNVDRIYNQLSEQGIQSEEWGGESQFVKVSALKRIGINELLEAILLQAELLELRACNEYPAKGVVLEANLDTGKGAVATVVVQNGTLRVGDYILAGHQMGKVRMMTDFLGRSFTEALPSTPVSVVGLASPPNAGDIFYKVEDEKQAKELLDVIIEKENRKKVKSSSSQGLEDLFSKMKEQDVFKLPIIIKADTQGSAEAIGDAVTKLSTEKIKNKVIYKGVGGISESDLILAQTSNAVIIGFNVRSISKNIDDMAEERGIVLKYFSVIYDVIDALKAIMVGKLPPILEEEVIGHAEVKDAISVSKVGTIAGSTVIDGKVTRNANVRLIRDSIVIYNGKISSLRRFKDDVKEVKSGYECGIGIENYNDIKVGDTLEIFVINEVTPTL